MLGHTMTLFRPVPPLLACLLLACSAPSSSAPPAQTEASPQGASASDGTSTAPPAPAESPSASQPPSARVLAVTSTNESIPVMRVKIEFKNPTSKPCRFKRYKLVWAGSSKEIKLEDLSIPAGESRERTLKVHPNDGDLNALSVESAQVEIQTDCGG